MEQLPSALAALADFEWGITGGDIALIVIFLVVALGVVILIIIALVRAVFRVGRAADKLLEPDEPPIPEARVVDRQERR